MARLQVRTRIENCQVDKPRSMNFARLAQMDAACCTTADDQPRPGQRIDLGERAA